MPEMVAHLPGATFSKNSAIVIGVSELRFSFSISSRQIPPLSTPSLWVQAHLLVPGSVRRGRVGDTAGLGRRPLDEDWWTMSDSCSSSSR